MKKKTILTWFMAMLLGVFGVGLFGCDEMEEAGDDAGDAIEEAADETGDAVENAADEIDQEV